MDIIVLHQLAHSGGTIFTHAMAAQGNCALVNEIHPYFSATRDGDFSPCTPLDQYLARYQHELNATKLVETREALFRFQIERISDLAAGRKLILREWSHGDFFESNQFSSSILPLLDFMTPLSVVSIRHPIDCYLSGKARDAWSSIGSDINEFCWRYHAFCDYFFKMSGVIVVRYEDFVRQPDATISELCKKSGLAFNPNYERELGKYRLSGSSGRMSYERITSRPRRPLTNAERKGFQKAEYFLRSCEAAGYPAEA